MKHTAPRLLVLGILGLVGLQRPLAAQRQFAESVKTYLPPVRDASRSIVAADLDGDGDRDLLVGNNEIVAGAQDRLLRNDGQGTFADVTAAALPPGLWFTNGMDVADVDGDGDLDFVTGDAWQNRLFLNDGSARFTDATFGRMPGQGSETRRLRLVDVDGDGDRDLVGANYRQETLSLNDGTGRFIDVTVTHMPVDAESTWELAVTDIDGDGDPDLAFAGQASTRLYRNTGGGHFVDATATHLPAMTAAAGASVTFVDLDGDGDRDLFVGLWDAQPMVLLNDGSGHFSDATAGRVPTTTGYHWREAFGDLDGDGDQDLVYTTVREDRLFLNDGTGFFADVSATRLPRVQGSTLDAGLADLDGDHDLDLFTAEVGQRNRLLFNDGAGTFANATPERLETTWVAAPALALGDLDGDGDLDLVAGSGDYGEAIEYDTLLLNDGRGNFLPAPAGNLPPALDDTRALVLGDVNGDGRPDIVLGNKNEQSRLLLNNGAAVFADVTATHLPAATHPTTALAMGDVDGDGDRDLVLGNLGAPCGLYRNDGNGHFTDVTPGSMPNVGFETRAIALGDLDGDGDLDLVLGNGLANNEQESVYINDGSGTFTDETASRVNEWWIFPTASLQLGDLDGDGDLDVVVGNDSIGLGRTNRVLQNDGTGHFIGRDLVYDYHRTAALALADVDLDGDLDAFCGDYDHYDKLYLNDGQGIFANATWPRMPATADRTASLAVGDVDGDGDIDLVRGSDWNIATLLINHHRQVWAPRLARLGTSWTIEVSAKAGHAPAAQFALPCLATAPAAIPLPPYGTLGLAPATLAVLPLLVLPAPAGTAATQVAIPNLPALVGQDIYCQALVLHTANVADARFTNVLFERVVR
ncbi:MAG: VCBS repeat-containing protein [Planctomycetes bacterium]|nr:VCBS repeat-containing protein [Planctomycetota bacterium]